MGYKVLFITLSKSGRGLWLRYTSLEGVKRRYSAFWLTLFNPGNPRGFMIRINDMLSISEDTVSNSSKLYSLSDGLSIGGMRGLEWSLKFTSTGRRFNPIPLVYRVLRRSSRYIIVDPNTVFYGFARFKGEEVEVNGYRGMIGFISGERYLDHWVWSHCSGFDEDSEGWVDVIVASPDGRRRVLFGLIEYQGELVHIGRFLGVRYDKALDLGEFKTEVKAGGYNIRLDVKALKQDMVVAVYEDPVEGYRYCHNTEIATLSILMEGRGRREKLNCSNRAFYEYALTRKLDESIPEIVEVTP